MGERKRRKKASDPITISEMAENSYNGVLIREVDEIPVSDYPKITRTVIDIPISDTPEITQTTIYPTIDAMWLECIANHPAMQNISRERREMTKFAFYTAISETLRTIAFRLNSDQNESVFDDFGKELLVYDRELQQQASNYAAELN